MMSLERESGLFLIILGILLDVLISIGFNPPRLGFANLTDSQVFGILGVGTAALGLIFYVYGGKHR